MHKSGAVGAGQIALKRDHTAFKGLPISKTWHLILKLLLVSKSKTLTPHVFSANYPPGPHPLVTEAS
eukprot:1145462-Pelagomonas_calceolata.AAC.5